jgi:hypothetical protein
VVFVISALVNCLSTQEIKVKINDKLSLSFITLLTEFAKHSELATCIREVLGSNLEPDPVEHD